MRRQTQVLLPGLFYLAVMILVTWPLLLGENFIGHPFGDSYEYTHHIWWINQALRTGQPLFEQPLLAYPDGLSGLWLWANPLQSFPAWLFAFVMPLPLAFNLAVLLRMALNGWAMYWLARDLSGKSGPALLAGLVFMLYPAFQGQLAIGHTGLLLLWPVPLLIYALRRLNSTGERRWLLVSALLLVVSLWGNMLLLIYLVAPLMLFLALRNLLQRNWRHLRQLLAVAALGGAISLIFIGPFLAYELGQPAQLNVGGDVTFSADLLGLVTPSPWHPLYQQLDYTGQSLGIDPWERLAYVGVIAGLLALLGLWRSRDARRWLLLALLTWLFSLGPLLKVLDQPLTLNLGEYSSFVTLPWLALADLPLINTVRTPARFNFVLGFILALLVAYGARVIWNRLRRLRWPLLLALVGLIFFDYQSFWPFPTVPGTVPDAIQALAQRDDIRAVMNLPWDHLLAQKDGMFLQTGHHKPMIAGHVTRRTPVDPAKLTLLQTTLDPALLDREGVDLLILHKEWASASDEASLRNLAAPVYEDERLLLVEVPEPDDAPGFRAVYTPSFAVEDETTQYVFAPEPGWFEVQASMNNGARDLRLFLDADWIYQRSDPGMFELPIFVSEPGYHRLTWAVLPSCPVHHIDTVACRSVDITDVTFAEFQPATFAEPVLFDKGISLRSYVVATDDGGVTVNLAWQFDQELDQNTVRFVHVINDECEAIAQRDDSLGQRPAGSQWNESLHFDDLPPGNYAIYTGWYHYPENLRIAIRSDVVDAPNNWLRLGSVQLD